MENSIIYMTSNGFKEQQNQLNEKVDELRVLQLERNEMQESLGRNGFNDPELVAMIQSENSLKGKIEDLQNLLGSTQIVEITDETRNMQQVRIGSIVKIDIYNISTDSGSSETWEITGYNETNIKEKKLAYNSPLAKKILGGAKGELIEEVLIQPNILDIQITALYKSWLDAPQN